MKGAVIGPTTLCVLFIHVWMLLVFPVVACAQTQADPAACVDGEAWASRTHISGGWFMLGLFLGPFGLIVPAVMTPSPPAIALVGKSPEYVAFFSECYGKKVKEMRIRTALGGCITGMALFLVLMLIGVAPVEGAE